MPLPGGYLIDTNSIVHLLRSDEVGRYADVTYGLSASGNRFIMSIVTVGEMYALARKLDWTERKRASMRTPLDNFPWVDISDPRILDAYGEIDCWSEANGRKMGKNDAWIAATARVTNTTILTTDKDFDDLHPINPSRAWRVDREWVDPNSKQPSRAVES